MKFTDEELSRILSAHEGHALIPGGGSHFVLCCLFQASTPGIHPARAYFVAASRGMRGMVQKFDRNYRREWTTTRFLRWLESQGVA